MIQIYTIQEIQKSKLTTQGIRVDLEEINLLKNTRFLILKIYSEFSLIQPKDLNRAWNSTPSIGKQKY